jgi:hypothetical protein
MPGARRIAIELGGGEPSRVPPTVIAPPPSVTLGMLLAGCAHAASGGQTPCCCAAIDNNHVVTPRRCNDMHTGKMLSLPAGNELAPSASKDGAPPLQLEPSKASNKRQGHQKRRALHSLGDGRRPLLFPCESRQSCGVRAKRGRHRRQSYDGV